MFYLYGIMLYNIQNNSFKEVPMNTPSPDLSSNFINFKRSYKVVEKELAAISVYNCGSQRCTPGYQWGPGRRDHYLRNWHLHHWFHHLFRFPRAGLFNPAQHHHLLPGR